MSVEIQVFEKGLDKIVLAWAPEDTASVRSFNLYISLIPGTSGYSVIKEKVANAEANDGITKGHVGVVIYLTEIQALGGDFATANFEENSFYFRATTLDPSNVESALADATTRAIGAIGVRTLQEQDDERKNRHNYSFAPEINAWHRSMGSSYGSMSVSTLGLYEDNLTITRTISGGNVTSELVYVTGSRSGSRAKLFTHSGAFATDGTGRSENTVITESVVP